MDKYQTEAEQLAESFICGNISYVKAHCKDKGIFVNVLEVIKELYPKEEACFIRVIGKN